MSHSLSATKNTPSSKVEPSPSKQKEIVGEEQISNSNTADYSRPTSAPPKLYTSLFLYTNDPFGCFTNDTQEIKEEEHNKFFSYLDNNEENPQGPIRNQQDPERADIKISEMNTIPEAKSELDISDMLSRQNSSLIDARMSPDRIDPATNKAIMDMFDDGFSLSDPKSKDQDSNQKESQSADPKQKQTVEKRFKGPENSKKPEDNNPSYQSGMYPNMGYVQNMYYPNNQQNYYNMMSQEYNNYNMPENMYPRGGMGAYPYMNYYSYGGGYNQNRNNQNQNNFSGNPKVKEEQIKPINSNSNGNSQNSNKKERKNEEEQRFGSEGFISTPQTIDPIEFERLIENALKLAKDQAGCRMLQKKLETNDPQIISKIYQEVINDFHELMTDPFGNYLCQKLAETCSVEELKKIIEVVSPNLITICFNPHGTRAVQKLIEVVKDQEMIDMVIKYLSTDVVGLVKDNNGNHVVQKCLTNMSDKNKQFIYDSIVLNCVEVATHKHGCCVIQRCLDHANEKQKDEMVRIIAQYALELVRDQYGNYVVQYVLDLKEVEDSVLEQISINLLEDIIELSKQKFSSNVIEKCLNLNITGFKERFSNVLINNEVLVDLICDKFGNYVVQKFLTNAEEHEIGMMLKIISENSIRIKNDVFGLKIFTKLSKSYSFLGDVDLSTSSGQIPQFNENILVPNNGNSSGNSQGFLGPPINGNTTISNSSSITSNNNSTISSNGGAKQNNYKENARRNPQPKNGEKKTTSNSNARNNRNNNNYGNHSQRNHYRNNNGNNNGGYHNNRTEMIQNGSNMAPNMMQPNYYISQPPIYGQYYNYNPQGVFYARNY